MGIKVPFRKKVSTKLFWLTIIELYYEEVYHFNLTFNVSKAKIFMKRHEYIFHQGYIYRQHFVLFRLKNNKGVCMQTISDHNFFFINLRKKF